MASVTSNDTRLSKDTRPDITVTRSELFQSAASGDLLQLTSILQTTGSGLDLSCRDMLDSVKKQNLLHCSIEAGQMEIAKYLVKNYDGNFLHQEYQSCSSGISGYINALQKLTEMRQTDICRLLLLKIKTNNNKHRLLHSETVFKYSDQRPRLFNALHIAAHVGSKALVKLYINNGVDVNCQNVKGDNALMWASRMGHLHVVRSLLKRKANADIQNDAGNTALCWAIKHGHAEIVDALLTDGRANVNLCKLTCHKIPIIKACAIGNSSILKLLLKHGADVNVCIMRMERPLHYASHNGHSEIIKTLLANGAEIDAINHKGDTGLIMAAKQGRSEAVQVLLKHGAESLLVNDDGRNVWHYAIDCEDEAVLFALVQNLKNSEKHTDVANKAVANIVKPISLAAANGEWAKMSLMLANGMDPDEVDDNGNTAFHMASYNNKHEVIDRFSEQLDVNRVNKYGDTPLHVAVDHGFHDTVVTLLKRRAKTNISNDRGETAIHVAAKSNRIKPETVWVLIEHTKTLHTRDCLTKCDRLLNNPLHLAAKHANKEVLWEFRAVKSFTKNNEGNTPLHEAVRPGESEILEKVLDILDIVKLDVNVNETNSNLQTVLHLASLARFSHSLRRLVQYGADLAVTDTDGNTALHCLTKATVQDPCNLNDYLRSMDILLEESVRWLCNCRKWGYPNNNDLFKEYKKEAILYLTNDILNHDNLNVLTLAAEIGASDVLERFLLMEDVTMFTSKSNVEYDVSNLSPLLTRVKSKCCDKQATPVLNSCFECVLHLTDRIRAATVLNIPPIRALEHNYAGICRLTYFLLLCIHVVYMVTFSYAGLGVLVDLRLERLSNTSSDTLTTNEILIYAVVPIEPLYSIISTLYIFISHAWMGEISLRGIANVIYAYKSHLSNLIFSTLTLVWIGLYVAGSWYQDYVLALCLCLGWLYTIAYSRGIRQIHTFRSMLMNIVTRDVIRFLFFYFWVLVAFSIAFHALFQISSTVSDHYPNVASTMFLVFNILVGMGELFDGTFEQGMSDVQRNVVFPKVLYIVYVCLSTIILFNFLIAMMNDTYQSILQHHQIRWRLDSVRVGIDMEKIMPSVTNLFSQFTVKKRQVPGISDQNEMTRTRWYLIISKDKLSQLLNKEHDEKDAMELVTNRLETLEEKLDFNTKQVEDLRRYLEAGDAKA